MADIAASPRPRRADAERSIAAILDAAVDVLAERPDASMAAIASAAGVTRQTVYAHYESREALLEAVADRALAETVRAIDGAEPDRGPALEAVHRLIDAWWRTVGHHARVLEALSTTLPSRQEVLHFHGPILERLERLIARGQRAGDFDNALPAAWFAASFLGLMHAAADEVAARRLSPDDAARALERTVPRLFGVPD
jgi:AcrR family transcriptional regulator